MHLLNVRLYALTREAEVLSLLFCVKFGVLQLKQTDMTEGRLEGKATIGGWRRDTCSALGTGRRAGICLGTPPGARLVGEVLE